MAPKVPLDWEILEQVFGKRKDILEGIKGAADSPDHVLLFNNIATFVYNELQARPAPEDEPALKRRRVDVATISQPNGRAAASKASNGTSVPVAGSQSAASGGGADDAASEQVLLEIKDVSLSAPQRKKYDLCFTKNFLYARVSGSSTPVQGIVYPWRDIEHAFYLPVPEKSQVQHNYVLFPRNSYLPTATGKAATETATPAPLEPLVFTIPATAPKPGSVLGSNASSAAPFSDSYTTLFNWAFSTSLRSAGNSTEIVSSDPRVFHSVARQPYRPSEKAVHVKAFRGSKDGYLFFLPTGILWGFKKPLLFLPLERIIALSYTSVLQRTFNIVVEYETFGPGKDGATSEEIEFGMLDQEDYAEIDNNYVRRHGLADRSMAEQRKAKRELAENAKGAKGEEGEEGGGEVAGDGAGADERMKGMTELEKAQFLEELRLQDEEDEDEEDYDPGSDGESEGSGSSDDDDDDDDDDDEDGEDEEDEGDLDEEGDEKMAG